MDQKEKMEYLKFLQKNGVSPTEETLDVEEPMSEEEYDKFMIEHEIEPMDDD